MDIPIIEARNLSKKFSTNLKRSMWYGSHDLLRRTFGLPVNTTSLRKGEKWALRDISFSVKKGEVFGLIGTNGSGKSTLLRLIYGIFPPNTGEVSVRGRIGALLAVGTGFHPHMTGRENIYLSGAILGLSGEKISALADEIIEFAEIGEYIDAPVSTYSSGMNVRLGFSISIHAAPEILIADEILGVGDLGFTLKCYRKIAEYQNGGGTIILVSHSMQLIRNTCRRVLWLEKGELKMMGESHEVCNAYENYILNRDLVQMQGKSLGTKINQDPEVSITNLFFIDENGREVKELNVGDPAIVQIRYHFKRDVQKPKFTFGILNTENILVYASYSDFKIEKLSSGIGSVAIDISQMNLKPGSYFCTVTLAENELINAIEWHEKCYPIKIKASSAFSDGILQIPSRWRTC